MLFKHYRAVDEIFDASGSLAAFIFGTFCLVIKLH